MLRSVTNHSATSEVLVLEQIPQQILPNTRALLYDNPAAALQSILEKAIAEKHDQSCHIVWRRILNVTPEDQGGLIAKLGLVMDLPRRTLILVRSAFPNQLKATEIWTASLESAFLQQHLAGNWGTFAAHIQPYCIAQLGLTSELIQTRLGISLLKEEDLLNVLSGLGELLAEIDQSSLDNDLKAYLGREICELQQMLRDYRVTGVIPILKQVESMAGHSLLDPKYSQFLSNHALGVRLLENLSAMANLLTVAVSLPQLSQGFGGLLLR